jgi:hypothetical protein
MAVFGFAQAMWQVHPGPCDSILRRLAISLFKLERCHGHRTVRKIRACLPDGLVPDMPVAENLVPMESKARTILVAPLSALARRDDYI